MTPYASVTRLTKQEVVELTYLSKRHYLWGGHLKRGELLNDPHMIRWRDLGLIEAVGTTGYRITPVGLRAINSMEEEVTIE